MSNSSFISRLFSIFSGRSREVESLTGGGRQSTATSQEPMEAEAGHVTPDLQAAPVELELDFQDPEVATDSTRAETPTEVVEAPSVEVDDDK